MKKNILIVSVLFAFLTSCSNEEDKSLSTEIENTMNEGNSFIFLYKDSVYSSQYTLDTKGEKNLQTKTLNLFIIKLNRMKIYQFMKE